MSLITTAWGTMLGKIVQSGVIELANVPVKMSTLLELVARLTQPDSSKVALFVAATDDVRSGEESTKSTWSQTRYEFYISKAVTLSQFKFFNRSTLLWKLHQFPYLRNCYGNSSWEDAQSETT